MIVIIAYTILSFIIAFIIFLAFRAWEGNGEKIDREIWYYRQASNTFRKEIEQFTSPDNKEKIKAIFLKCRYSQAIINEIKQYEEERKEFDYQNQKSNLFLFNNLELLWKIFIQTKENNRKSSENIVPTEHLLNIAAQELGSKFAASSFLEQAKLSGGMIISDKFCQIRIYITHPYRTNQNGSLKQLKLDSQTTIQEINEFKK